MPKFGTVSLTFKSPDVIHHAVKDRLKEVMQERFVKALERAGMDGSEHDSIEDFSDDSEAYDYYEDRMKETIGKFIRYGEYITVNINLDTGEATVLPASRA